MEWKLLEVTNETGKWVRPVIRGTDVILLAYRILSLRGWHQTKMKRCRGVGTCHRRGWSAVTIGLFPIPGVWASCPHAQPHRLCSSRCLIFQHGPDLLLSEGTRHSELFSNPQGSWWRCEKGSGDHVEDQEMRIPWASISFSLDLVSLWMLDSVNRLTVS